MKIVVIDGQGGGLGRQLVDAIKKGLPEVEITAIGTNTIATSAMLKAGADIAVTGENPVIVACRTAELIVGPIGIAIADSLYGEITPAIAAAVGQSSAKKILVPVNHCNNVVVGVAEASMGKLVQEAAEEVKKIVLQA